jgi:hypothetical protein
MPDRPDVCAHFQTRPDIRGHRPPRSTSEVPNHRASGPRTLARLDARPRRRTRRDGRHGDLVLDLLTGSLAPTTYIKYGTIIRRFTVFATKRASPRYKLPRPICIALKHGSPEHE